MGRLFGFALATLPQTIYYLLYYIIPYTVQKHNVSFRGLHKGLHGLPYETPQIRLHILWGLHKIKGAVSPFWVWQLLLYVFLYGFLEFLDGYGIALFNGMGDAV